MACIACKDHWWVALWYADMLCYGIITVKMGRFAESRDLGKAGYFIGKLAFSTVQFI